MFNIAQIVRSAANRAGTRRVLPPEFRSGRPGLRRPGLSDFGPYPYPSKEELQFDQNDFPIPPVKFDPKASAYVTRQLAPGQLRFDATGYTPSLSQQQQNATPAESFESQVPNGDLPTEMQYPPPEPCETGTEGMDNIENMNDSPEDQMLEGLGFSNRIRQRHKKKAAYYMRERQRSRSISGFGDSNPVTDLATQALNIYSQSLAVKQAQQTAAQRAQMASLFPPTGSFGGIPTSALVVGGGLLVAYLLFMGLGSMPRRRR